MSAQAHMHSHMHSHASMLAPAPPCRALGRYMQGGRRHGTPRMALRPLHQIKPLPALPSLVVGFLPWSGCDTGGFYGTGRGEAPSCSRHAYVHSHACKLALSRPSARPPAGIKVPGCQEVYQPAAAAEERFKAVRSLGAGPTPQPAPALQIEVSAAEPSPGPPSALEPTPQPASSLSEEAKGFLRDELLAEQRQRTQELVDAAWQSLE
jgi:hypothetical protein